MRRSIARFAALCQRIEFTVGTSFNPRPGARFCVKCNKSSPNQADRGVDHHGSRRERAIGTMFDLARHGGGKESFWDLLGRSWLPAEKEADDEWRAVEPRAGSSMCWSRPGGTSKHRKG